MEEQIIDAVATTETVKTVETLKETIELEVSEALANSIRDYQMGFQELNNRLELVVKGFILGQNVQPDKYTASFSEDLSKMTLKLKPQSINE